MPAQAAVVRLAPVLPTATDDADDGADAADEIVGDYDNTESEGGATTPRARSSRRPSEDAEAWHGIAPAEPSRRKSSTSQASFQSGRGLATIAWGEVKETEPSPSSPSSSGRPQGKAGFPGFRRQLGVLLGGLAESFALGGDAWVQEGPLRLPIFTMAQAAFVTGLCISFMLLQHQGVEAQVGLETLLPGATMLLVQEDCVDRRYQVWRWLSYQFTHSGLSHALTNTIVLLVAGIPLECFHGTVRTAFMFNVGVFGGACCYFVADIHKEVIGMSGGCYALQGIHLSDVIINWREKKLSWVKLLLLALIAAADILNTRFFVANPSRIANSVHVGGYMAGLVIGTLAGRSLAERRCERALKAVVLLVAFALATVCVSWGQAWPPRDVWDQVPWCWARQVQSPTAFGDEQWHCVRCRGSSCISRWSAYPAVDTVDPDACSKIGWAFTEH